MMSYQAKHFFSPMCPTIGKSTSSKTSAQQEPHDSLRNDMRKVGCVSVVIEGRFLTGRDHQHEAHQVPKILKILVITILVIA